MRLGIFQYRFTVQGKTFVIGFTFKTTVKQLPRFLRRETLEKYTMFQLEMKFLTLRLQKELLLCCISLRV